VLRPQAGRFELEITARPTEVGAPPIADGAVQVKGLEGASVSNLVRQEETRWKADVVPAGAGQKGRAMVELWVYGEPVGRASAGAEGTESCSGEVSDHSCWVGSGGKTRKVMT